MSRRLHFGSIAFWVVGLLAAGCAAQASTLTEKNAAQAISECLRGNGTVEVKQIGDDDSAGNVKIEITNYTVVDATTGKSKTISGAGSAHFMTYDERIWNLRQVHTPDGEFHGCHVDIKLEE